MALASGDSERMEERMDGRCQEICEICKARCVKPEDMKKCDFWSDTPPHACIAHSAEMKEIRAKAWDKRKAAESEMVKDFLKYRPPFPYEIPEWAHGEFLALVYPNYVRPQI